MGALEAAWSDGDAYDAYIGRWSRPVARAFLAWLDAGAGKRWLDVGCGTGALSGVIDELAAPQRVLGVDASPAYVQHARTLVASERVTFVVGDASALDYDGAVDVAVSGLVLNFLPEPLITVEAMACAVVPGGWVAAYLWDYAGRMELLRHFWDAAVSLDPAAGGLDEGTRFPLCDPERLAGLWQAAGLDEVETTALDTPTVFADFDDYWAPFLGGQGPAPSYIASLDEPRRQALRRALQSSLPIAVDGSIPLTARAWAVKGRKPDLWSRP